MFQFNGSPQQVNKHGCKLRHVYRSAPEKISVTDYRHRAYITIGEILQNKHILHLRKKLEENTKMATRGAAAAFVIWKHRSNPSLRSLSSHHFYPVFKPQIIPKGNKLGFATEYLKK